MRITAGKGGSARANVTRCQGKRSRSRVLFQSAVKYIGKSCQDGKKRCFAEYGRNLLLRNGQNTTAGFAESVSRSLTDYKLSSHEHDLRSLGLLLAHVGRQRFASTIAVDAVP